MLRGEKACGTEPPGGGWLQERMEMRTFSSKNSFKNFSYGNSLTVLRLGLSTFTDVACVQSLVGELKKEKRTSSVKLVALLCPTFCYPMDCSPPDTSVHRILQARILEWIAVPFSRGSSPPRDRTRVFCIAGR